MSANPSKSELCYLTKKPIDKGGLSFLSKRFTSKYNNAKVGILYDINQARKKNEKDNRPR